jgi:hypothetical protein
MDIEAIGQQTYFPGFKINGYLEEQLRLFEVVSPSQTFSPFVPVMSTSIDDLYGELLSTDSSLPIIIAYDTLSRFRPNVFYRQKREQILYTVHGPQEKVFAAVRIINAALDREDSAAQDVNRWASENQASSAGSSQDIFFHNFKTFQIDESRDLLEVQAAQGSMRMIYRNKIIVQYDYHTVDPLDAFYT